MQELATVTPARAAELVSETGTEILGNKEGGYWDKQDVLTLIRESDRITEYTGVGHFLKIQINSEFYTVDLMTG